MFLSSFTRHTTLLARSLSCVMALACSTWVSAQTTPKMPAGPEMFSWVEQLCAHGPRIPGTDASRRASQFVHDQFKDAGLSRVGFDNARTRVWTASKHGLVVNGQVIASSPMHHTFNEGQPTVFSTGPQGLKAEMVFVGDGSAVDFALQNVRGKIVVANVRFPKLVKWVLDPLLLGIQDSAGTFPPNYVQVDPYSSNNYPANYQRALKAGAVGFVGILADYFDRHTYRNEAYGAYREGRAMKIPGLWVSPVAGAKLAQELKKARPKLQATLTLEGELKYEQGRAVYGYLPGQSDEIILVQSHHDSNTTGAVEDASGTAAVIALAKYYAQVPLSQRKRTLMFATMDTHFTDYAAHVAFGVKRLMLNNQAGDNVLAVVTVEHIGNEWIAGPDKQPKATGLTLPRVMMVPSDIKGMKEIALGAMRRHKLERTFAIGTGWMSFVSGGSGLPADSSGFYQLGLPVMGLVGIPLYLYDDIDTPDKVNPDDLHQVATFFTDVIDGMSALPSANYKRRPNKIADLDKLVEAVNAESQAAP